MEEMVSINGPLAAYDGRTVLVTGHTGFKGTWLSLWLRMLGAKVVGFSLSPPEGEPSMYEDVGLDSKVVSIIGDIRDLGHLAETIRVHKPSIVFHMAAQSLVKRSYREPRETFEANVMGTINVLEAMRAEGGVQACTVVTSDKCYANDGRDHAFKEDDCLGGRDPYSASKAAAEMVTASYRWSFFSPALSKVALSTARAGNVIGGGDWAEDRIAPDIIRSLRSGRTISVRNPLSVRPWQHVLEPLFGYLLLTAKMIKDGEKYSGPWNFGPDHRNCTVKEIVERFIRAWGSGSWEHVGDGTTNQGEAKTLRLDSTRSNTVLGWYPRLDLDNAVNMTVEWYKADISRSYDMWDFSERQIRRYGSMPSYVERK
ncbi:MAG: CDP-glucose 4,6-dehydratase [Methanomassiliicoccus sp.]|nr:CDP-glucose 4,6-dehydratase [Methanomassiliicoccus sp.]